MLVASAPTTEPATNTASAATNSRVRPRRSPTFPYTGMLIVAAAT